MPNLPFPDLRTRLLPDTLLFVETFQQGESDLSLEEQIARWVESTGNLVVIPGPVVYSEGAFRIAVSYVKASYHEQAKSKA